MKQIQERPVRVCENWSQPIASEGEQQSCMVTTRRGTAKAVATEENPRGNKSERETTPHHRVVGKCTVA